MKRRAALQRRHVREFVGFGLVGASGYVVNLVVFALAYEARTGHLVAATLGFLIAVSNNFMLNRRWVFGTVHGCRARRQAPRYLLVSVAGFLVSLGILEILVRAAGATALAAQAIAILAVTPLSFAGQKLWSFGAPGAVRTAIALLR